MKERLSMYADIAEVLGAIAVVVSLAFVGMQISQSNSLVITDSLRDATQLWVGEYSEAFGTEESTAFMRKAAHHYDDLNKDEQGKFFAQVMGFVAAYDNVYNQYQAGSLREDVFVSISKAYHGIISLPGAQTV